MKPDFKQLLNTLAAPNLLGTGESDPLKRQALAHFALDLSLEISPATGFVDPVLLTYLEKLMRNPQSISMRDIELLNMVGYTDNEIYEVTLSVVLGIRLSDHGHATVGSHIDMDEMPAGVESEMALA